MALTQDELDQVYNYVMGKGQSLAGLPDGGSDLSSMYLAPLLKYSPGGKATLVRLAVSVLKGDSAYQVWVNEPGNAGKTLSDFFLSIKGAKGDPFTFADFTPEQLVDLALTYEKLTPEQKEEMKLRFGDLTEADILILQKPATDAADEVREQMIQISQNVSAAIKAASDAAGNAQEAADNVQDGKTPILESVNAQSGVVPSGSFTQNGVDAEGNPKYILNLTSPKGKDGQPAIFEQGTTTTLEPAEDARVDVVGNGETEQGNPKYILNFFIPRGQIGKPGEGSGNVSADGTGLVIGKKYLFVPDSDGSTSGTFVEYVAPEIPEQVQPDWNATEGKGAILHKPGDATADASGLMSADQFQKLEKLNPSYLSNDVTGKKVEYTDTGKLLFEDKETFAVDADNELTLAGKKLSELGGGAQYLDLSPLIDAEGNPVVTVTDEFLSKLEEAYNKKYTNASASWADNAVMPMSIQYYGDENIYSIIIGIITNNAGEFLIFSYTLTISTTNKSLNFTPLGIQLSLSGDGTKALMNDGTYKEVGGDYQLPGATDSALGGIKTGYTASGKNYPVQLDGNDKAYVNVPWTDTNTTYDLATTSTNGLMSSTDKTKLDKVDSYVTASSISNLDVTKKVIYVALTANGSLSANNAGAAYNGQSFSVKIYCSAARTITIPTSGNYVSMCGSSYTCPAGKRVEFHFEGINGQWWIAKLEQE